MTSQTSPAPSNRPPLSFEFFLPKTPDGAKALNETIKKLHSFYPDFCSVTHGAGGQGGTASLETITELKTKGIKVAPHVSCVGTTIAQLTARLENHREQGIRRLVLIRGDLSPTSAHLPVPPQTDTLTKAADLVSFVRKTFGDWFHIDVAAYPEVHPKARTIAEDIAAFREKVEAGANSAITQYFYCAEAYDQFREDVMKAGICVPIVPGIMPINQYEQLLRFSETCGAEIPRWIKLRLAAYSGDAASLRAFGVEVVARLCQNLLRAGAPGLHFYTLNQSEALSKVLYELPWSTARHF